MWLCQATVGDTVHWSQGLACDSVSPVVVTIVDTRDIIVTMLLCLNYPPVSDPCIYVGDWCVVSGLCVQSGEESCLTPSVSTCVAS